MEWRWVVPYAVLAAGCGHDAGPSQPDTGEDFLGDWECFTGSREIACGQEEVRVADLALGPSNVLHFVEGTRTNLRLLIPSRALVPGLPGGPICELDLQATRDVAHLQAPSVCTDDQGESILVEQGSAELTWTPGQIYVVTTATTVAGCRNKTSAPCNFKH